MVALPSSDFWIVSFSPFMSATISEGNILRETMTFANSGRLLGPEKPHFWHLYGRPKPRHFSQRQMVVSPHWGQGNFTAPSRGSIMRPHQLQEGIRTVRTSVNIDNNSR